MVLGVPRHRREVHPVLVHHVGDQLDLSGGESEVLFSFNISLSLKLTNNLRFCNFRFVSFCYWNFLLFLQLVYHALLSPCKGQDSIGVQSHPHSSHVLLHGDPVVPVILHGLAVRLNIELGGSFLLLPDPASVPPIVIHLPLLQLLQPGHFYFTSEPFTSSCTSH